MFVCNHITYGFKDRKNGPSLYSSGQIKSTTKISVKILTILFHVFQYFSALVGARTLNSIRAFSCDLYASNGMLLSSKKRIL